MNNTKICPHCQKENKVEAVLCLYCSMPLNGMMPTRTTEHVPDLPIKMPSREQVIQLTKLYADTLGLLIVDQEQPILVKGTGKVILGRHSPGDVPPSVDLNPYNASLLGVSRQHSVISRSNKTYVIEDLASTNGTWLNEVRLTARKPYDLQSGDLVRLGQLAFYVYFNLTDTAESTQETIHLKNPTPDIPNIRLSPHVLATQVAPYLSALAGIQAICNEILGRDPVDMNILTISVDPYKSVISVKTDGIKDAIRLARTKFDDWRDQYFAKIKSLNLSESETTKPGANTINPNPSSPNTLPAILQEAETQLALEFLLELAPHRTEEFRKGYLEKLLTYLHTLLFSAIRMDTSQQINGAEPKPDATEVSFITSEQKSAPNTSAQSAGIETKLISSELPMALPATIEPTKSPSDTK
jgi:hypothetical protein